MAVLQKTLATYQYMNASSLNPGDFEKVFEFDKFIFRSSGPCGDV